MSDLRGFLHESIEQNIIVKGRMSDIRGFLTLKNFLVDLRGFLFAPGGNIMHFRVMRSSPSVSSIFFIIETTSIPFSEKSRLTRFLNQSVEILARGECATLDENLAEPIYLRTTQMESQIPFTKEELNNVVEPIFPAQLLQKLLKLINNYRDCSACKTNELGKAKQGALRICIKDKEPVTYIKKNQNALAGEIYIHKALSRHPSVHTHTNISQSLSVIRGIMKITHSYQPMK